MLTPAQDGDGNVATSDTESTGSIPDLETVSDDTWTTMQPPPSTQPRRLEPTEVHRLAPRPDSPRPSVFDGPLSPLSDGPRSPAFTSSRPPLLETLRRPAGSDRVQGSGHLFEQYLLFVYGEQPVSVLLS